MINKIKINKILILKNVYIKLVANVYIKCLSLIYHYYQYQQLYGYIYEMICT